MTHDAPTDSLTDALVIERDFDAPIAVIWQMWTDPEHFAAWYGPDGTTIPVAKIDLRPGGTRLVCMEVPTPDGPLQMWFTGEHLDIAENTRLVYTESICDADGNILDPSAMGMPDDHPTTTEVRVELTDIDGRTRLVLTHTGIPGDSPAATGWAMALTKLAAHAT